MDNIIAIVGLILAVYLYKWLAGRFIDINIDTRKQHLERRFDAIRGDLLKWGQTLDFTHEHNVLGYGGLHDFRVQFRLDHLNAIKSIYNSKEFPSNQEVNQAVFMINKYNEDAKNLKKNLNELERERTRKHKAYWT